VKLFYSKGQMFQNYFADLIALSLLCYFLFMIFPIIANNKSNKKAIKRLIKTFEVCCRFAKKKGISL